MILRASSLVPRAAGGPEDLAEQVGNANTARHAAELWDQAGLLPAAGRELCARAARVLSRFSAEIAGPGTEPPQVRVIMVDFTGQQRIAAWMRPSGPPASGSVA